MNSSEFVRKLAAALPKTSCPVVEVGEIPQHDGMWTSVFTFDSDTGDPIQVGKVVGSTNRLNPDSELQVRVIFKSIYTDKDIVRAVSLIKEVDRVAVKTSWLPGFRDDVYA